MTETPQSTLTSASPRGPTVPLKYFLIAVLVAVVALFLASFSSYSLKKTEDKVTMLSATSSSGVTIFKWQDVAGKAYPVTEYLSDSSVVSQKQEDKTVTTIKSGCTLGVAMSTKGAPGIYLAPDILAFGPGNVQVLGMASKDEVIAGIGYRLNF